MANLAIEAGIGVKADRLFKNLNYAAQPRPRMRFGKTAYMASPPTIYSGVLSGATAATLVSGGTGYTVGDLLTVSGGSNVAYALTIRVLAVSGGVITSAGIERAGAYGTTPSNAVAVTGGTGSGATFNITWNVTAPAQYSSVVNVAANSGLIKYTGHAIGATTGGIGNTARGSAEWIGDFWSDEPIINIVLVAGQTYAMVYVYNEITGDWEKVQSDQFATGASGSAYSIFLDWGGVRQMRRYRIAGINMTLLRLRIGPSSTVWFPKETDRPLLYVFGDSYVNLTGTTLGSGFYHIFARALDMDVMGNGVGGTGWKTTGSDEPLTRIAATLNADTFSDRPLWGVVIPFGYNDANGSGLDVVQSKCYDTLVAVYTKRPATRIFLVSPWTPLGTVTNLTLVKDAMKAAYDAFVAAYPDARAYWIDIDNWVNGSNKAVFTSGDNVHANVVGHEYLGARIGNEICNKVWGA